MAPNKDGTGSLTKCLDLFCRIAADGGEIPLGLLVRDMGLPRSTLYRLLGALERAGLIVRLRRGHFGAGLTAAELLHRTTPNQQMAAVSRPFLARLAAQCGATAHLGVLDNDMVTYLVKVSDTDSQTEFFTQEDAQLEAYCTGIGKVLLAWLPAADQALYLAGGPFVRLTARTITAPDALRASLLAVRDQRWARDDGEIAEHLYCLAVPLWTETLPMRAAISLSFQDQDKNSPDHDMVHLTALRRCAETISRRLGRH